MRRPPAFVAALLLIGCAAAGAAGDSPPLEGAWGGAHVSLRLGPAGGRLEYDCAAGEIGQALRPDGAGRFAAAGVHIPGHGGPDRIGEAPKRLPADYSGRVEGGRMTLRVRVRSTGVELGPFTLRRGAAPTLVRCL